MVSGAAPLFYLLLVMPYVLSVMTYALWVMTYALCITPYALRATPCAKQLAQLPLMLVLGAHLHRGGNRSGIVEKSGRFPA